MIRVVIDPGVFISSLIGSRGGPPDLLVRAFVDERISVVASPMLLEEIERVLLRPKFSAYVDEPTVREFVDRIRRHANLTQDPVTPPPATRDPKDDYLVALARDQVVDAIVSGDRDLLEAGLDDVAVWTPREALDRLQA